MPARRPEDGELAWVGLVFIEHRVQNSSGEGVLSQEIWHIGNAEAADCGGAQCFHIVASERLDDRFHESCRNVGIHLYSWDSYIGHVLANWG
jgi:hypothetical protein